LDITAICRNRPLGLLFNRSLPAGRQAGKDLFLQFYQPQNLNRFLTEENLLVKHKNPLKYFAFSNHRYKLEFPVFRLTLDKKSINFKEKKELFF